ncbi:MAG: hypothetical protein KAJ49_06255 [Arcobacteraceae bacterium]|nr:hypothetical protein [Arcobacteraceae bacterium]
MTYLVDNGRLLSTFNVNHFDLLHDAISCVAPSMCEYYLNDLIISSIDTYLNKNNIEQSINIDLYNIHIDYDSNIYIESLNSDDTQTESLW